MNRREFLRRIALIGIGAAAFPFFPAVVKASWYIPSALPGVTIRPTYLKFGPLENRFVSSFTILAWQIMTMFRRKPFITGI